MCLASFGARVQLEFCGFLQASSSARHSWKRNCLPSSTCCPTTACSKGASARHQLLLQDMPLRSTSRLAQVCLVVWFGGSLCCSKSGGTHSAFFSSGIPPAANGPPASRHNFPPAARSSQAGRLPLDFNSKQVTRAAAAQAAAEAAKAAGQGGGRVRRYFPPASTDADSYTVLKFHPLEDSMVHAGGC